MYLRCVCVCTYVHAEVTLFLLVDQCVYSLPLVPRLHTVVRKASVQHDKGSCLHKGWCPAFTTTQLCSSVDTSVSVDASLTRDFTRFQCDWLCVVKFNYNFNCFSSLNCTSSICSCAWKFNDQQMRTVIKCSRDLHDIFSKVWKPRIYSYKSKNVIINNIKNISSQ